MSVPYRWLDDDEHLCPCGNIAKETSHLCQPCFVVIYEDYADQKIQDQLDRRIS